MFTPSIFQEEAIFIPKHYKTIIKTDVKLEVNYRKV